MIVGIIAIACDHILLHNHNNAIIDIIVFPSIKRLLFNML